MALGWDDILSVPTMGLYTAQKELGGVDIKDIGEGAKDFSNVGKNRFQPTPYDVQEQYWGGDPEAAQRYYDLGMKGLGGSNQDAAYQSGQMRNPEQAVENQILSDREATARDFHQGGALNLALRGALGNQPSEAAYQLQSGLDRSIGQQTAMAGGARGAAGLAVAGSNQAAATGALQNQAFTEAGRLRAQEIAGYSNLYGQLAGQQRQQDLGRLNMGNEMSQFNAQNRQGWANLANQSRQSGLGYYQTMPQGFNQAYQGGIQQQGQRADAYGQSLGLGASIAQANADKASRDKDRYTNLAIQGTTTFGGMATGQGKS